MWDANQYLKYADERARPFFDLLARVRVEHPGFIVDLGCGPGTLTRSLVERWPGARVLGIDNSPEMLEQARSLAIPGRLGFAQADIACWSPVERADLIVSNAILQWIDDHDRLLTRLARTLAPAGTLAVQMPYHFEDPGHLAIEETKADSRWSAALQGVAFGWEPFGAAVDGTGARYLSSAVPNNWLLNRRRGRCSLRRKRPAKCWRLSFSRPRS